MGRGGQGGRRARGRHLADLIAYARERLGGFKPKSVDSAEVLPRTPSGKLLKRTLREPYWEGVGRRIG